MTDWFPATLLKSEIIGPGVMSLTFTPSVWIPHQPGQHYDIRLTAPNGYQAQRSYSVASAPETTNQIEFVVEILPGGEVSPYLKSLQPGGQIEIRGPIGGHFIWNVSFPGPLVVIGGGTGLAPLMSILRHAAVHQDPRPIHLIASFQTEKHILFYHELRAMNSKLTNFQLTFTLTRQSPPNWPGHLGRVDQNLLLNKLGSLIGLMPMIYVCGPTGFVETVATDLVEIGFNPHEIRTERFG